MPVQVRIERHFRVVGVDYGNVVKPQCLLSRSYEQTEACFGGQIEAAYMTVAGVEAIANRDVQVEAHQLSNRRKLFQLAAQLRACACGVFQQ